MEASLFSKVSTFLFAVFFALFFKKKAHDIPVIIPIRTEPKKFQEKEKIMFSLL